MKQVYALAKIHYPWEELGRDLSVRGEAWELLRSWKTQLGDHETIYGGLVEEDGPDIWDEIDVEWHKAGAPMIARISSARSTRRSPNEHRPREDQREVGLE